MTEFSLRALSVTVLAEMDSEDREQIVKEIARRVPDDMVVEAFHQALPAYVHQVTSRWVLPLPAGSRAKGTSAKVTAIRETWRRHLEGRYTVEDGSYRRLGDFRERDLLFKAGELENKARATRERAKAMRGLAGAMRKHQAERVRDLPAGFLAEFFGAEAA